MHYTADAPTPPRFSHHMADFVAGPAPVLALPTRAMVPAPGGPVPIVAHAADPVELALELDVADVLHLAARRLEGKGTSHMTAGDGSCCCVVKALDQSL